MKCMGVCAEIQSHNHNVVEYHQFSHDIQPRCGCVRIIHFPTGFHPWLITFKSFRLPIPQLVIPWFLNQFPHQNTAATPDEISNPPH